MKQLFFVITALTAFSSGFAQNAGEEKTDTIISDSNPINLQEVVVMGRLATQTDYGISYNMAGNRRAQNENILQALAYVPLVSTDVNGAISVQGSSSVSFYLNGRPCEMAQTSPAAFLESLHASSVAKVEVITHPDNKFGSDAQRYIINIVLKQHRLDGYVFKLAGGGNTQPSASGSMMGMLKKNKVNAAITYDYNLSGQRHQPASITYTEHDSKGDVSHIWENELRGDGDWHTHTMRAMLKWEIDSLNTLYADAHGMISRTDLTTDRVQSELFPTTDLPETLLSDHSKYTSGSAEANVIYRNYSKDDSETERITVGYHYTYNPDKRHIRQSRSSDGVTYPDFLQRTDGGLNAHTGLFSYLFRPSALHSVRFSASDIYRRGSTESSYTLGETEQPGHSMKYANNIATLNATYSGRIGNVNCMISAKGNYDRLSMRLPQTPDLNYKTERYYFLPSASLYWRLNNNNALYLDYSTDLERPAISMLNPFESTSNDHSVSRGNPNLKAQYNHNLALTWYLTGIKSLTLAASVEYTHAKDVILSDYYVVDQKMIHTYSNIGRADQAELQMNIRYEPAKWVSLSVNGGAGKRWLRSDSRLKQNDMTYRVTPRVDFYLPNQYRIGGQYGYYKNLPNPWSHENSMTLYSFYVNKSFLSGRLNVTVLANSPFNKYIHGKTVTTLPTMTTEQNNYITARSFGIHLSYSFSGGQKVRIERDRTLRSTDLNTGVY